LIAGFNPNANAMVRSVDSSATNVYVSGRVIASVKEAVCKGTISFLAREARKPGSYFWLRGGKRAEHLAALPVT
jgi:hypothetical protein